MPDKLVCSSWVKFILNERSCLKSKFYVCLSHASVVKCRQSVGFFFFALSKAMVLQRAGCPERGRGGNGDSWTMKNYMFYLVSLGVHKEENGENNAENSFLPLK